MGAKKIILELKKTLGGAIVLVFTASFMGILFNYPLIKDFLSHGIKMNPPRDLSQISLKEAKELFDQDEVVFIDARSEKEYQEGHIQRAINIPVGKFDSSLGKDIFELTHDKIIITYCNGIGCQSSFNLTRLLGKNGFEKVRTFYGGWSEWTEAGYPIE